MHNDNAPKEKSSIFIFLPVTLIGVYLVYLTAIVPFRAGLEGGAVERLLNPPPAPAVVEERVFDHRRLIRPTDDLIALGSRVYANNCASCHGATGYGDGTAGRNLTVKPRNFHELNGWKVGASTLQMYETLNNGLGSMPAFPALNPEQRYAVIHFIHAEFMQELAVPQDSDAAIAALPAPGAGAPVRIDAYADPRVPVDFAILQMIRESRRGENPARNL